MLPFPKNTHVLQEHAGLFLDPQTSGDFGTASLPRPAYDRKLISTPAARHTRQGLRSRHAAAMCMSVQSRSQAFVSFIRYPHIYTSL